MLHFLVRAAYDSTLREYFAHWGARLASAVEIHHYESFDWGGDPAGGTWVFADIERLDEPLLARATAFCTHLASDPRRWQFVNDPSRVLRRHALLQRLWDEGVNSFRAFRLHEIAQDARFPLFVRGENDHEGTRSPLLADWHELHAFTGKYDRRLREIGPLATEYLDYRREDGLFAKYSAMRVGAALVPRHILFARQWHVKNPEHVAGRLVLEENAYISNAAHTADVMRIFDMADIGWGRIDYTVVNGRIQVFEINTNPTLVPAVAKLDPRRWQGQAASAFRLNIALHEFGARRKAAS